MLAPDRSDFPTAKAWQVTRITATGKITSTPVKQQQEILSSSKANEILQTASLTKVATALVVLNNCSKTQLKRKVTVSATAASVKQGTHAKLRAGDRLSITELLYGLMLPSGNDAAEALAEHVGKKLLQRPCDHFNNHDGPGDGHHHGNAGRYERAHADANAEGCRCGCGCGCGEVGEDRDGGLRLGGDATASSGKENSTAQQELNQNQNQSQNASGINPHAVVLQRKKTMKPTTMATTRPPKSVDASGTGMPASTSSPTQDAASTDPATPIAAAAAAPPSASESRQRFLDEMHNTCAALGLVNTRFRNPHGMALDGGNTSTCEEITRLCIEAMKHPLFCKIMSTAFYTCASTGSVWKNTNDLLRGQPFAAKSSMKFGGVKTGWVPNQHGQKVWGCLASVVTHRRSKEKLLLVVMGCDSKKARFSDTTLLATQGFASVPNAQ